MGTLCTNLPPIQVPILPKAKKDEARNVKKKKDKTLKINRQSRWMEPT
jgi:hypothetical protein